MGGHQPFQYGPCLKALFFSFFCFNKTGPKDKAREKIRLVLSYQWSLIFQRISSALLLIFFSPDHCLFMVPSRPEATPPAPAMFIHKSQRLRASESLCFVDHVYDKRGVRTVRTLMIVSLTESRTVDNLTEGHMAEGSTRALPHPWSEALGISPFYFFYCLQNK